MGKTRSNGKNWRKMEKVAFIGLLGKYLERMREIVVTCARDIWKLVFDGLFEGI